MSTGKYSPTVSHSYRKDKDWWEKNGGGEQPDGSYSSYDKYGYDRYGYDCNDRDRAGNTENNYLASGDWIEYSDGHEEYVYHLYETVASDWDKTYLGPREE